ncbi:MAG: hypothetical protein KBH07_05440 [Flavobacteriales bacterium]|nr:hypothetical protein [Flavobacteriales bacterium]MBP9080490.1 hypothetical protein [Flavobacteriales bacterium]
MAVDEPFRSLAEYRAERQRWAGTSGLYAGRLRTHLAAIRDKETRRGLAREAATGLLRSALPQSMSSALSATGMGNALHLVLGRGKAGWTKRALLFGLGLVAPALVAKVEQLPLRKLVREVGISLDRVQAYLRER